jgi:hypothetical protein
MRESQNGSYGVSAIDSAHSPTWVYCENRDACCRALTYWPARPNVESRILTEFAFGQLFSNPLSFGATSPIGTFCEVPTLRFSAYRGRPEVMGGQPE